MKNRAFTLVETLITSGVLLLMVGMASMAVVSYLKSYRRYTEQGTVLRMEAKTLESLCFRLRSMRVLHLPVPQDLSRARLRFEETPGQLSEFHIDQGKLWLSGRALGPACNLQMTLVGSRLLLKTQHLQTQISLRGVRQP